MLKNHHLICFPQLFYSSLLLSIQSAKFLTVFQSPFCSFKNDFMNVHLSYEIHSKEIHIISFCYEILNDEIFLNQLFNENLFFISLNLKIYFSQCLVIICSGTPSLVWFDNFRYHSLIESFYFWNPVFIIVFSH